MLILKLFLIDFLIHFIFLAFLSLFIVLLSDFLSHENICIIYVNKLHENFPVTIAENLRCFIF